MLPVLLELRENTEHRPGSTDCGYTNPSYLHGCGTSDDTDVGEEVASFAVVANANNLWKNEMVWRIFKQLL